VYAVAMLSRKGRYLVLASAKTSRQQVALATASGKWWCTSRCLKVRRFIQTWKGRGRIRCSDFVSLPGYHLSITFITSAGISGLLPALIAVTLPFKVRCNFQLFVPVGRYWTP